MVTVAVALIVLSNPGVHSSPHECNCLAEYLSLATRTGGAREQSHAGEQSPQPHEPHHELHEPRSPHGSPHAHDPHVVDVLAYQFRLGADKKHTNMSANSAQPVVEASMASLRRAIESSMSGEGARRARTPKVHGLGCPSLRAVGMAPPQAAEGADGASAPAAAPLVDREIACPPELAHPPSCFAVRMEEVRLAALDAHPGSSFVVVEQDMLWLSSAVDIFRGSARRGCDVTLLLRMDKNERMPGALNTGLVFVRSTPEVRGLWQSVINESARIARRGCRGGLNQAGVLSAVYGSRVTNDLVTVPASELRGGGAASGGTFGGTGEGTRRPGGGEDYRLPSPRRAQH